MSEYQYYEFVAIDRPLGDRQLAEVRQLSTRARITSTSFVNEYHWGSFRGEPNRMIERYYDAHLYVANWGSRRLVLRLPQSLLDLDVAERYAVGEQFTTWTAGKHLILDFSSEDDESDFDVAAETWLPTLLGVRAEIAVGDLRPLYLAWLAGYGTWERDEDVFDRDHDDELEPPVPPGLRTLSAAQQALAEFLRLDADLLHVAAAASPDRAPADTRGLASWIGGLTVKEKDRLLLRVAGDDAAAVHLELLHRFRGQPGISAEGVDQRTVADLLDGSARFRNERERREAQARTAEFARREARQARAYQRQLDRLAQDEEQAWARAESLISTKKPNDYETAVTLLTDLHALAERDGSTDDFDRRISALRLEHARKPALIRRLDTACLGISDGGSR